MREIKFRGYSEDLDKWVYGDLLQYRVLPIIFDGECEQHECFHSSIGQYTGLKDKNGEEIYEGDIITTDLERNYLIVEYRNGAFMLNCNDGLEDYYDIFFATSDEPTEVYKYGEVIGNIYENPELLEVEE